MWSALFALTDGIYLTMTEISISLIRLAYSNLPIKHHRWFLPCCAKHEHQYSVQGMTKQYSGMLEVLQ